MPDIHIHRPHELGLPAARKAAFAWAEKAERKLDMECAYEEGDTLDTVYFSRAGVKGTLGVTAHAFDLRAELGMLVRPFQRLIENELNEQFDALLQTRAPARSKASAPARKKKA